VRIHELISSLFNEWIGRHARAIHDRYRDAMMNLPTVPFEQDVLLLIEREILSHGRGDLSESLKYLDDIDWIEIFFAVEDRYGLDVDDRILDAAHSGPSQFAKAIVSTFARGVGKSVGRRGLCKLDLSKEGADQ
jgi:hypothetical protein